MSDAQHPQAFASFTTFRLAHTDLLRRTRDGTPLPALQEQMLTFLASGVQTGALFDNDEERQSAQTMLDYWAALLYRQGIESPDPTLLEFDPARAPELPDALCPYVGLDAFSEHTAGMFFGRDKLIAACILMLTEQRIITIISDSGSGKSSLVFGGVIPALQAGAIEHSEQWHYLLRLVPGSNPLANIARLLRPPGAPTTWSDEQVAQLKADPAHLLTLMTPPSGQPAVLIIDQFEELFTLCDNTAVREAFVAALLALLDVPAPRHRVIMTLRSDFESRLVTLSALHKKVADHVIRVTALSPAELRDVIEQPAELVGLKFADGIVDDLVRNILGEPAGLPLLQFTLLKLWETRERNRIPWEAYQRLGGVREALTRSADQVYMSFLPEEQETVKRILLHMVRPGEGLEVTSRRVLRATLYGIGEAPERIERVLKRLHHARLIRSTPGDTPADDQLEVAHEALVRNWRLLITWINDERTALDQRRRLDIKVAEWISFGRGVDGLLDAKQLELADGWLSSHYAHVLGFDAALPDLVKASRSALEAAAREQERLEYQERELERVHLRADAEQARAEAQLSLNRRLKAFIVVALIAITASFVAWVSLARSREAQQRATSAMQAQALVEAEADVRMLLFQSQIVDQPETRFFLSLEAAKRVQAKHLTTLDASARQILYRSFAALPHRLTQLSGHTADIWQVRWSPDGKTVLTASLDGTAKLWSPDGALKTTLVGHKAVVWSATWSPAGDAILTASLDGTAKLWSPDGTLLATFVSGTSGVTSATWSPDGKRILITSQDTTATIWDRDARLLTTLTGHTAAVAGATWSPDSQRVVTTSEDKTAKLWSVDGTLLVTLNGHIEGVTSSAWSPDGQHIVTTSYDKTAKLWTAEGTFLRTLNGHTDVVWYAAWSPDGRQLVTTSSDQTAKLWNADGTLHLTLLGHTAPVWNSTWSPNGQYLVSVSSDHTARIWRADGTLVAPLLGHTAPVWSATWSPNGQQLATASGDQSVTVWTATGASLAKLTGHTEWIGRIAWSPDGQHLAAVAEDQRVYIWSNDGTVTSTLQGHSAQVVMVAWSPDGKQLVTASEDHTAKVWQSDGTLESTLIGHSDGLKYVAWSPDGKQIVTASADHTARIWKPDGRLQATLMDHTDWVARVAWSPDSQSIVTASYDHTAKIWTLHGALMATLRDHMDRVRSVEWSPDGQQIVTASYDHTAKIWQRDGTLITTLIGHTAQVAGATWSPDGKRIVTASFDQTAKVWQTDGTLIATLTGHTDRVRSAAWSPNGRSIVTASDDHTVKIWESDGKFTQTVTAYSAATWSSLWSPDGLHGATACADGAILLWRRDQIGVMILENRRLNSAAELALPDLIRLAEQLLPRQLTPQERHQFIDTVLFDPVLLNTSSIFSGAIATPADPPGPTAQAATPTPK